ncbi:MAG: hypothetical protein V8S98_13340 [Lachnospiraceae bacterium]
MADISKELDNFKNAKYGKDVRGSMVSLAEKLNKESSDTVKTVSEYGDAEVSREQAEQDRQNAENARQQDFETMQSDSQVATIAANKAAERAEQAATGDISLKTVTFEVAAARSGIVSGDTLGVAFGKLAKYCTDIEDHAFNALVNNGLANIAGVSALDAVQANPDVADTLAYKIAQNLAAITSLNSNMYEIYRHKHVVNAVANQAVQIQGQMVLGFLFQQTVIVYISADSRLAYDGSDLYFVINLIGNSVLASGVQELTMRFFELLISLRVL